MGEEFYFRHVYVILALSENSEAENKIEPGVKGKRVPLEKVSTGLYVLGTGQAMPEASHS